MSVSAEGGVRGTTRFCLGKALARLGERAALDETLDRFPDRQVDLTDAGPSPTSTVVG